MSEQQQKFLEELEKNLARQEQTVIFAMQLRQQFPQIFHPKLYLFLR